MAIHIFVICLVVLGLQNIISITIHKKRFSKQVDELQKQLDEKKEESIHDSEIQEKLEEDHRIFENEK